MPIYITQLLVGLYLLIGVLIGYFWVSSPHKFYDHPWGVSLFLLVGWPILIAILIVSTVYCGMVELRKDLFVKKRKW